MKYEFSKYLIIARGSIVCSKKAKGKKSMKDATREFINPEDEIFLQVLTNSQLESLDQI